MWEGPGTFTPDEGAWEGPGVFIPDEDGPGNSDATGILPSGECQW